MRVIGEACCKDGKGGDVRTESQVPRFLRQMGRGCKGVVVFLYLAEDQSVRMGGVSTAMKGRGGREPPQTLPVS